MSITPREPADFTPSMGSYRPLTPFRYWCQKVLPLVYDDSLSYYEVLCKVVDYLNKTMEDVETLNGDVEGLHTAYVQLQNYVNSYFTSLDVQSEINNKLDEMASDGTLDTLLLPYFNAYKTEINGIVAEQNQTINNQNNILNNQTSRINVLEGRMDEFTNLPEGSTTGDAELADIRIGANGITYNNAGDAVRGQFGQLENDLEEATLIDYISVTSASSGHYINSLGEIADNANMSYSVPINVSKGTKINFLACGNGTSVAMIARVYNGQYTPLSVSLDSTLRTYSYTALDDMIIVVSYNTDETHNLTLYSLITSIYSEIHELENSGVIDYMSITPSVEGKYISATGTLETNIQYTVSDVISLKKGYKIVFTGSGAVNNVAMIALFDGTNYIPLAMSVSNDVHTYIYEAVNDTNIVLCYNHSKQHNATIYADIEHLVDIANAIEPSQLNFCESHTNIYNPNTVSTGYINNTGNISSSAAYRYTDFIPVNGGDVIRFNYTSALAGQFCQYYNSSKVFYQTGRDVTRVVDENAYCESIVPAGASYIVVNLPVSAETSFVINKNEPFSVETAGMMGTIIELKDGYEFRTDTNNILKVENGELFNYICCIGDSLTEGEYGTDVSTQQNIGIHEGYPSFLARSLNCKVENLGYGGMTTKTWWENKESKFTPEQLTFSRYDCFIIFLGTNGGLSGNPDPTEDSLMGYYCKIIQKCRTEAPNAKIFLVGFPWSVNRTVEKMTDLVTLATAENLPILDLYTSPILTYSQRLVNQPFDTVLHYGRLGYIRLASEIQRYINAEVETHPSSYAKFVDDIQ